jgi:predicted Zn-dependent peptidase
MASLPAAALVLAAASLGLPATLRAQVMTDALPPIPIDTFSLDNGLRVVVSEDHSAPVVAVNVWYHVGSANEEEGRSGFAHLFEHMLFSETENLEPGAMDRLVTRAGGVYNATTSNDRTAYFEVLPSNRVNLALWLHAERMARLKVTAEAFETQREVVKEERRMRIDNQPYGQAQLVLDTLSQTYAPYRHTVIGSMADLDAAETSDVATFYERFYVPSNAVLTVVGDVTAADVRALAEEYLGDIPGGRRAPDLPPFPATPRSDGERRAVVDDPFAQLPLLWVAYTIPPASHSDQYALDLLSSIFSVGESSRLRERLVNTERAALDLVSFVDRRVGPGTFRLGALPNQGVTIDRVEALVQEEIERLRTDGVSERELQKAKNAQRAALVAERLTVQSKATALQQALMDHGTPYRVNQEMGLYEAVTQDDIRRVAMSYLVPENRTVVVARPAQEGGDR